MQITCRSCDEPVPAEDVNLDRALAKCRKCHAVFDFSDQVELSELRGGRRPDKTNLPLPAGLTVEDFVNTLTLTVKWGRGVAAFFVIFALIWDGVLVTAFSVVATQKDANIPLPMFFIFPPVGLAFTYVALALLLDRTTIRVADGRLTVRQGPIPWPGNREVDTASLDQLFCMEYVAYLQNNVPQYRYAVHAIPKEGEKFRLIKGLKEPEQAIYLEGLLEKHLGIQDRPVRGELTG